MIILYYRVSIPQSEFCPLGHSQAMMTIASITSFNSSVGILSVGTKKCQRLHAPELQVSIPQSEFCPLGPTAFWAATLNPSRFNSSVGILSVGTWIWCHCKIVPWIVSIPQSEFCPLGLWLAAWRGAPGAEVSIPQSEFCPLGPSTRPLAGESHPRFNSSVGILSVGTSEVDGMSAKASDLFQFLSRNSVRWDCGGDCGRYFA